MIDEQLHQQHQDLMLEILQEFDRICKLLGIQYVLFAGSLLGAVRHKGFIPWDDDLDVLLLREDYLRFLELAPQYLDTRRFYLQREFDEHWPMFFSKLRMNGTTCIERFRAKDPAMHQGIYIDVFPCDDAATTIVGRVIQFAASKVVIAKGLSARGYNTNSWIKKLFIGFCKLLPIAPFLWITKNGEKKSKLVHSFLGGASSYCKNVFPRTMLTEVEDGEFEGKAYPIPKQYDTMLCTMFGNYLSTPDERERKIKQHAVLVDVDKSFEKYADYWEGKRIDEHSRSIR